MNVRVIVEKQDDNTRDDYGGFQDIWYPALNEESDITESGTTTTNITIANHGLVTGDYITNITRGNILREVTVVDDDNVTVTAISSQTDGDSVLLHKYADSKVWARYENKLSSYIDENQQRKIITKSKVTIRYRTDIEQSFRFRIGSRHFEILSFHNIDEKDYYMEFDCRELK